VSKYSKILEDWNAEQENRKALFTEFLYQRSGRTNGLFIGLWQEWCEECGVQAREEHFTAIDFGESKIKRA
jgi:hypothetical protein